jgi:hypothetical protein
MRKSCPRTHLSCWVLGFDSGCQTAEPRRLSKAPVPWSCLRIYLSFYLACCTTTLCDPVIDDNPTFLTAIFHDVRWYNRAMDAVCQWRFHHIPSNIRPDISCGHSGVPRGRLSHLVCYCMCTPAMKHDRELIVSHIQAVYTAQCSLGYTLGIAAHGLANNGLSDEQRSALSPEDPEYTFRVIGSKIQVAGWTTAICLLWTLKLCIAFFYLRLTVRHQHTLFIQSIIR